MQTSRTLLWRAACLSLGIHTLAFALLVETPVLPRLRADPGGAVSVHLLSAPAAPPAPAAAPPGSRQPPPTPVVSPLPPPPPVKPPPPRPKPRPVVAAKPQPPQPPAAPDPPSPPLLQEGTPFLKLPAPATAPAVQGPAPQSSGSPTPAGAGGLQAGAAGPGTDTIAELIRHLEAHRRYPAQARRRGIEGTVGLAFRVAPDGDLLVAEVRQPSGSLLLDRAAMRTLERAFPLPPHLAERLAGEELTIDLAFRLVDR